MSQQQREAIKSLLAQSPLDPAGDPLVQRPLFEQMITAIPVPADVVATPGHLGGIPVITIDIPGITTEGVILYFHGGFFAIGSAAASIGLAASLGRQAQMQVITVDYRLAPENPYPAGLTDAVTAYRALLDRGQDMSRVAVVGESAGANLAIASLIEIQRSALPQPSSVVALSPLVDLTGSGASITAKADMDPVITAEAVRRRAKDYLAGADATDPLVSPIFADLRGLPPLLIQVGSHEVLLDDATRLATRAAGDDVAVTLEVTPGVPHVFQAFADHLDEGAAALNRAGAFLRSHVEAPVTTEHHQHDA